MDDVGLTTQGTGQVTFGQPAPDHQRGWQLQGGNGVDAVNFFITHGGDADFHLWHTGCGQCAGNGAFFIDCESHSGGLFAVAQGGVIDDEVQRHGVASFAYLFARCMPSVFRPLAGHLNPFEGRFVGSWQRLLAALSGMLVGIVAFRTERGCSAPSTCRVSDGIVVCYILHSIKCMFIKD